MSLGPGYASLNAVFAPSARTLHAFTNHMIVSQYESTREDVLNIVDQSIRQLGDDGQEAKYIVAGTEAYRMLRKAIGERFQRGAGSFESYQYIPIVLDPFRTTEICVLPAPSVLQDGTQTYTFPAS